MKPLSTALLVLASCCVIAGPLASQEPALQADPLFGALFTPELIMQHRRDIVLTDRQRDDISRLIQDLQSKVVRLQWELVDATQQLTGALGRDRVDLDLALDRLDKVLDTERKVKQAHLEMLVRIKNLLTEEQQATLRKLQNEPQSSGS